MRQRINKKALEEWESMATHRATARDQGRPWPFLSTDERIVSLEISEERARAQIEAAYRGLFRTPPNPPGIQRATALHPILTR